MSSFLSIQSPKSARRFFLAQSGLLLSGAAVALLAGRDALAAKGSAAEGDVRILNTALGAELEAIAAYQVGAESGLLQKPVLALAVQFQGHHKSHADLLAKTEVLSRRAEELREEPFHPAVFADLAELHEERSERLAERAVARQARRDARVRRGKLLVQADPNRYAHLIRRT